MSINSQALEFLCAAKNHGVDFSDLLTIGRQGFAPRADVLKTVLRALCVPEDQEIRSSDDYFMKALGTKTLAAMDYSDYQGATVIHDLNRPIPPELRNRYGVVFDGGTLEHVFNISQGYKNLMQMVRVGGWFAQLTEANNSMGHGFWQISPETLFRCLSPENGFEVHAVLLKERPADSDWHAVRDPIVVHGRVGLTNSHRTYLLALARKTADVEVFARTPQQSDYVSAWEEAAAKNDRGPEFNRILSVSKPSTLKRTYRRIVPSSVRFQIYKMRMTLAGKKLDDPFDRVYFTKLNLEDFLRGNLGPSPSAPL